MTGGGRQKRTRIAALGVSLAAVAALLALATPGAEASTVTLDGSGQMSFSFQYLWTDPSTASLGNDYVLTVPGQYTFLDQFLTQQPSSPDLATSPVGRYDFQDSYRFTIGQGAGGDVLTASLTSGSAFDISNLQFRLYSVPSSSTAPVVGGLPAGATLVQSWIGAGRIELDRRELRRHTDGHLHTRYRRDRERHFRGHVRRPARPGERRARAGGAVAVWLGARSGRRAPAARTGSRADLTRSSITARTPPAVPRPRRVLVRPHGPSVIIPPPIGVGVAS